MALQAIDNYEIEDALVKFEQNSSLYPSYITFNNLGVFYSRFGKDLTAFNELQTYNLAKKALTEACNLKLNYNSLSELGDLLLNSKLNKEASRSYEMALQLNESNAVLNNYAVSKFLLKDYIAAEKFFRLAANKTNEDDIKVLVEEAVGFSLAKQYKLEKANQQLHMISQITDYQKSPDTLLLASLCKNYSYITAYYHEVYQFWNITPGLFQTVANAYLQMDNICGFENFKNESRNNLLKFYSDNPEFDKNDLKEMLNVIDKGPYVPLDDYLPQLIYQDNFLNIN